MIPGMTMPTMAVLTAARVMQFGDLLAVQRLDDVRTIAGSWTWADGAMFIGMVLVIRACFFWLATKAFMLMIPDGDRCLMCDGETLAIRREGWWRVLGPRFRRSWCLGCGWEGLLRRSQVPTMFAPVTREHVPSHKV